MRRRDGGFSFVDLIAGVLVTTIGLVGISTILVMGERAYRKGVEETHATHALRNTVESLRAANFDDALSTFQGHSFNVPELSGTGSVTIFVDESDTSPDAVALGMPRDLDGDGASTTTNIAGSYLLLPVKVEVTWTGIDGTESRSSCLLLSKDR